LRSAIEIYRARRIRTFVHGVPAVNVRSIGQSRCTVPAIPATDGEPDVQPHASGWQKYEPQHGLDVDNSVVVAYLRSLRRVDGSEVGLLELLHTLVSNTAVATADTLNVFIAATESVTECYRDAAGTLVVRHEEACGDRLTLLWPVGRSVDNPTEATVVRGGGDEVFVEASGAGDVVPLAAAAVDRHEYSWGHNGTGPINLYMALVYAVDGTQAPITLPPDEDDPRSLYGWLTRQDREAELHIPWPDLVRRVHDDLPLR
jgi:hypothetical protein